MNEYKEAILLNIIRETYPKLNFENYRVYGWSWNSYVIELDGSLIFKIPKTEKSETALEREILITDLLSKHLSVEVPRYKYREKYNDTMLVAGYTKIEGEPLTNQQYAGKNIGIGLRTIRAKSHIYSQLSEILAELHSLPIKKFKVKGLPDEQGERWKDRFEMLYYKIHDSAYPLLKKRMRNKIEKAFKTFINEESNFEFTGRFIHGDFGGWNILYDPRSKNITGIIDWENAVIGDPAFDFSELLYDFGAEATEKILKHYKLDTDPGLLERMNFYRSLAGIYDILYGSENGDAEILNRGFEAIKQDFEKH
jgi:aminoglycoside 2''-phosphotransferase